MCVYEVAAQIYEYTILWGCSDGISIEKGTLQLTSTTKDTQICYYY